MAKWHWKQRRISVYDERQNGATNNKMQSRTAVKLCYEQQLEDETWWLHRWLWKNGPTPIFLSENDDSDTNSETNIAIGRNHPEPPNYEGEDNPSGESVFDQ